TGVQTCALPICEHRVDRLGGLRSFIGQHVGGVGRVAEHLGLLDAQLHHVRDDAGVIPLVGAAATGDGRFVQALAQGAVLEVGVGGLAGGVLQRDDVLAIEATGLGGLGGGGDGLVGQTCQLLDA